LTTKEYQPKILSHIPIFINETTARSALKNELGKKGKGGKEYTKKVWLRIIELERQQ
jgi:hypothetical protein